jgi:signal transduction histidine kinase
MNELSGAILIAVGNQLNRQKLASMIEQQGHRVEHSENGQQAADRLHAGGIDVVLLDIAMTGMPGMLERIRASAELPDTSVIVLAATDEPGSVLQCIRAGADDCLTADTAPELLALRLQSALRKSRLHHLETDLRQSDKLATLGRLTAGVAHELNNPASAATRAATVLQESLTQYLDTQLQFAGPGLTSEQVARLRSLVHTMLDSATTVTDGDALARSDREMAIEQWLSDRGITASWETPRTLADLDIPQSTLDALAAEFAPGQSGAVLDWLAQTAEIARLGHEIAEGAGRVSAIAGALKSYSYRDKPEPQSVDIHDGLNKTLIMFGGRLKRGVSVHRDFADGLPAVQGHAGELNQVWTNIIDNAIDAMDGSGTLNLLTRREGNHVVVSIENSGPAIPEDVLPHLFDPFFTTKPPGEGTGLGLNITHTIVTGSHGGRIEVQSEPGSTRFDIWLPISGRPRARS